jgi:hypothetical protein
MIKRYLALGFLCCSLPLHAENAVVWDFTTRDGQKTSITASLTMEFEEALAQKGIYTVLERRNLPRLQSVIANEKALEDVAQISQATTAELRKAGVSIVVFGEMFDDVESGEVSVTVTFQDFKGTQRLIKSILMRRSLIRDATSRRERLGALADSIAGATAPTTSPGVKNARVQESDFIIDLKGCSLTDRTVQCRLSITNNGEDRTLSIALFAKHGYHRGETDFEKGTKTRIFDDFNNEAFASDVRLSNAASDRDQPVVSATLIQGRPAEAIIRFQGLSSKATTVTRLDIACSEGNKHAQFVATFRNIPLK